MSECDKVCNSVHLPFQSGSSKILKKMNRHYTKEQYLTLVEKIRKALPHAEITTDIIVGFPGESEEDFKETLEVVEKVEFISAFTFIYSKRTGTPAATMEDQVDPAVVKERFNRLLEVTERIAYTRMKAYQDRVVDVLLEEESKSDSEMLNGRSDENILVHVKAPDTLKGKLVQVKITECKPHYLIGELI